MQSVVKLTINVGHKCLVCLNVQSNSRQEMYKVILVLVLVISAFQQIRTANFTCLNGNLIDADTICNGIADCVDLSDERFELCGSLVCQADQFKCYYGACISRQYVCDKNLSCIDGSDEFNCGKAFESCELDEFRCSSSGQCIDSSLICNQVQDCPGGEDEAKICQPQFCPSNNTFRCDSGRCIDKKSLCDNFNDCINGDDESDFLCKSLSCFGPDCDYPNCPPITSNRLQVSCNYNGHSSTCDKNIKPGTVATYSCGAFYQPLSDLHKLNNEAVCQANGKWSAEILRCEPKCGYLKKPVPLIVNGFPTDITLPWHATIFIRRDNIFTFACGATLITELVVLTAAHCFTDVIESDLKIVVGKRRSNFTASFDETLAQYFDVNRIFRHPLYLDRIGNYGSDIALVILNETVALSDDIHPACIDWELDDITSHLSRNQVGVLVGMGINENDTNSEEIRMARLPIVSNEDCIKKQPKDFKKYITFTTFCVGWGNGTSPCNGDSGGGLIFLSKDSKTWKVQGIVSLSLRRQSTFFCDPFKYTIFTKVGLYVKWIRFILDNIHGAHTRPNATEYEPIL